MKEYKIIRQKINLLKNTNDKFEKELNTFAHQGWCVVSAVNGDDGRGLKVILERDKNR